MTQEELNQSAASQQLGNAIRSLILVVMLFGLVLLLAYGGCFIYASIKAYTGWRSHRLSEMDFDDGLMAHLLPHANAAFMTAAPYVAAAAAVWIVIAFVYNNAIIGAATGAREVSPAVEPQLYNMTKALCDRAGMAMPKLAIMDTEALNAFASGMSEGQYTVTVTRGLMRKLTADELEGVIAHELSHIKHHDVRLMVIAGVITGGIGMLAWVIYEVIASGAYRLGALAGGDEESPGLLATVGAMIVGFVFLIISWFAAELISLALSRRREFLADAGAAHMTGNPDALVSALKKVCEDSELDAPAAVMQMAIASPRKMLAGLLSTHPEPNARMGALATMPRRARVAPKAARPAGEPRTGFGLRAAG
jgi:heat shock protein HtpX